MQYINDGDKNKIQWEDTKRSSNIKVLEIILFVFCPQQNGRDQKPGKHEENIHAHPANGREARDEMQSFVAGEIVCPLEQMKRHDHNDRNPPNTIQFPDPLIHKTTCQCSAKALDSDSTWRFS